MNNIPAITPDFNPANAPLLSDLRPVEAMEWMHSNIWTTFSPGWQGAREALCFDGRADSIVLYRGEMVRTSYDEYVSLVRSGVVAPDPRIPLPDCLSCCPTVHLRFRRSSRRAVPGVVYIIGNGKGEYKIGRAKNAARRLAQIQSASPDTLTLHMVFTTPDSLNTERWFHHFFFRQRISGEWFRLSDDDVVEAWEAYNE